MQSLPLGAVIDGKYKIVEELGRGGMGVVFRAVQLATNREVALKTMLPQARVNNDHTERFKRELNVVCSLDHPNTITIYDAGSLDNGTLYFAMELLKGDSLGEHLEAHHTMAPERVRRVLLQVLKSLAEAHAKGIVHRDLKPDNIFLCELHGEKDYVKVLDFGIAKALGESDDLSGKLTATGATFGTPRYMAPEQLNAEPIAASADIYALGHTAYEMLTGESAYGETTLMALIAQKLKPEPPPLRADVVRGPFGPIIARSTQNLEARRYQSCAEMIADLEALGDLSGIPALVRGTLSEVPISVDRTSGAIGSTPPRPVAPVPGGAPKRSRKGLWLGLAALAIIGLLTLVGLGTLGALYYTGDDERASEAETVTVTITSEPEGATVYANNKRIGKTPLTLERPKRKKAVQLTIRKKGYKAVNKRITPSKDINTTVRLQKRDKKKDPKDKDEARDDDSEEAVAASSSRSRRKTGQRAPAADEDDPKGLEKTLEGARKTAEGAKKTAEGARKTAEGANKAADALRQSKLKEAEAKRKAADAKRNALLKEAEAKRKAADAKRKAADAKRKAAEAKRKAADARRKLRGLDNF